DRLESGKLMRWLGRLQEADGRRLGGYLFENQSELLALYLYRSIEVYIREHDQEASEMPADTFTLEGQFYIRIPEIEELDPEVDGARQEAIRWLLEDYADRDYAGYQKIMLETVTVLPAEMEEEAYRMRNVRLAERGVPPFHEAIGIYQPLSRKRVDKISRTGRRANSDVSAGSLAPILPEELLPPDELLAQALARVPAGSFLDRLRGELAFLGNAVIVADQERLTCREELAAVMGKVVSRIAMGLEEVAGQAVTAAQAARWLKRVALPDLFRIGQGAILELHGKAKTWVARSWFNRQGLPITFWDEAGMGVVGGLLLKRPRCYDPSQSGETYREFESLGELAAAESELTQLAVWDDLLEALELPLIQTSREGAPLTYRNLILTFWVHHLLGGAAGSPGPLTHDQLCDLLPRLFERPGSGQGVSPGAKDQFWAWLAQRSGWSSVELDERLGKTANLLFEEIAEVLGHMAPADLDPRYIELFIVDLPEK
ncbi:MAG: DUF6178 family protein, partial [Desulfobacterales bacterium]